MLSTLGRRAVMMTSRRLPALAGRFPVAAMSTATHTQLAQTEQVLENFFDRLHWHDKKDDVKDIEHLMQEYKTNHAVPEPDDAFDLEVAERMDTILQSLKEKMIDHNEVNHELFQLKELVKGKLYA